MKRWIAKFFLISVMVLPFIAAAYSGGSGTLSDPYLIGNVADLLQLAGNPSDYDRYFIQTADIDLWGNSFDQAVIAPDTDSSENEFSGTPFTGEYDGDGYFVRNLKISATSAASYIGMFGLNSGTIQNVHLDMLDITSENGDRVGGICGSNDGQIRASSASGQLTAGDAGCGGVCGNNHGSISACFADVSLQAGVYHSGGLCGFNNGSIAYSSSQGTVTGDGDSKRFGGLCGKNDAEGHIQECFSTAEVNGGNTAGGLCGSNIGTIENAYAHGAVSVTGNNSGGLCGYNESDATIKYCYSTGAVSGTKYVGGLCGTNKSSKVTKSFWDIESSGVAEGGNAGTGVTTAQMQSQTTFTAVGWDFSRIWQMDGYPALRRATSPPLVSVLWLEIDGPDSVNETDNADFTADAYLSDEAVDDVTAEAQWSVVPPASATIAAGVLTPGSVASNIVLLVIAEYGGIAATQSVTVVDESTPDPGSGYSESFEEDMGLWSNISGLDTSWYRNSGATLTAYTGPDDAADGEMYLYVDASSRSYPGKTAAVEAEFNFTQFQVPQLIFKYHMYGAHMGSLHVDLFDGTAWHDSVWEISGEQHESEDAEWSQAEVDLAAASGVSNALIRIRGVTGTSYQSDIAIDDISLLDGANDGNYSGGNGSAEFPYIIADKENLLAIADNSDVHYDRHFRVTADIDMLGDTYDTPLIAPDSMEPFTGSFDGDGHSIYNFTLDGEWAPEAAGLFGYLSESQVKNLLLDQITFSNFDFSDNIGALCGHSIGSSISNCHATAVDIQCVSSEYVGGLIGYLAPVRENSDWTGFVTNHLFDSSAECEIQAADAQSTGGLVGYCGGVVSNCSASVIIQGSEDAGGIGGFVGVINSKCVASSASVSLNCYAYFSEGFGGFCGRAEAEAEITACYVSGSLVLGGEPMQAGGFCGANAGFIEKSYATGGTLQATGSVANVGGFCGENEGTLQNCFTHDAVECGSNSYNIGGFSGYNLGTVTHCYSTGGIMAGDASNDVGGFCGLSDGTVEDCFWDMETAGVSGSSGGTATNTAAMQSVDTYTDVGWDFTGESVNGSDDIWYMQDYPLLSGIDFEVVFLPQTLPYSNSFESGFDVWQPSEISDFEWSLNSGPTDSPGTGPLNASDGVWYIYAEASDHVPQQVAAVEAPFNLNHANEPLLQFDYHVYGQDAGSLYVDVFNGRSWIETFWNVTGQQHISSDSPWSTATLDLSGFVDSLIKIRFRVVTGSSYIGDIAVDNVRMTDTVEKELSSISVEGSGEVSEMQSIQLEGWAFYDDGSSEKITTNAVWSASPSEYASVTGGLFSAGSVSSDEAVTVTMSYQGLSVDQTVTILNDPLFIIVDGSREVLERQAIQLEGFACYEGEIYENITQEAEWSVDDPVASVADGLFTAGVVPSNYTVKVTMTYRNLSVQEDISILDIPPASPPVTNSFENGMRTWDASPGFDFDWSLNSGSTPSAHTGPDSASDGSNYLYIEASGNCPNKSAAVETEFDLRSTLSPLLEFDYHMYGSYIGSLTVDVFDGAIWHSDVWSMVGQQHFSSSEQWSSDTVNLSMFAGEVVKIRFVATSGQFELGDIAIDNVRLTDPGPRAYSEWLLDEGVPGGESGENDTPADDGIPNLLKYACGLPAMTPATTADYMNIIVDADQDEFGIAYYKSKAAVNVLLEPLWTYDLTGEWTAQGLTITETGETENNREIWKAVLHGSDAAFFKLRATLLPE
ncbi:MAG: GLUG motif-containing protein [Kiritimatiellia bacterium]